MSLSADLLRQARHLASREPRRPSQASLRRSISTAYYALFHLLVEEATGRMFPGRDRAPLRACLARAFDHGNMKAVGRQFSSGGVSSKLLPALSDRPLQAELRDVAEAFAELQEARHEADYDRTRRFTRKEANDLLKQAERAFADWRAVRKTVQADAFLAGLLALAHMRN